MFGDCLSVFILISHEHYVLRACVLGLLRANRTQVILNVNSDTSSVQNMFRRGSESINDTCSTSNKTYTVLLR